MGAADLTFLKPLIALALLLLPASLSAQGLPIAPQGLDLRAVGRVNAAFYSDRKMCSGTLVAPTRVLTAAHCVFRQGRAISPADLRFVAGWDRGEAFAHRGVADVIVHPQAYTGGQLDPRFDLAVLILDSPLTELDPVPVVAFDGGSHGLAGYQGTRPHLIGARLDCRGWSHADGLVESDCLVVQGASGGAGLVETSDGLAVWGAISSVTLATTLIAPVGDWDAIWP